MTNPPQPPEAKAKQTAEIISTVFLWTVMVGTGILQLLLLAPLASETTSVVLRVEFYASCCALQLLWLLTLITEEVDRHDRRWANSQRRTGLVTQVILIGINAAGGTRHLPYTVIAVFFIIVSATAWHSWIRARALHPEDQIVINELIHSEAQLSHQAFQERQKQAREAQLRDAVTRVRRRQPPVTRGQAATSLPPSRWKVSRGRHAPIVYFLRNGNRIKIGTTTDLYQRIRRLSLRAEHVALVIPGSRDQERRLHRQFADLRVGNTEWFHDLNPLTEFIDTHPAQANTQKEA